MAGDIRLSARRFLTDRYNIQSGSLDKNARRRGYNSYLEWARAEGWSADYEIAQHQQKEEAVSPVTQQTATQQEASRVGFVPADSAGLYAVPEDIKQEGTKTTYTSEPGQKIIINQRQARPRTMAPIEEVSRLKSGTIIVYDGPDDYVGQKYDAAFQEQNTARPVYTLQKYAGPLIGGGDATNINPAKYKYGTGPNPFDKFVAGLGEESGVVPAFRGAIKTYSSRRIDTSNETQVKAFMSGKQTPVSPTLLADPDFYSFLAVPSVVAGAYYAPATVGAVVSGISAINLAKNAPQIFSDSESAGRATANVFGVVTGASAVLPKLKIFYAKSLLTEIPAEKLVDPLVLAGERKLPRVYSIQESIQSFQEGATSKPKTISSYEKITISTKSPQALPKDPYIVASESYVGKISKVKGYTTKPGVWVGSASPAPLSGTTINPPKTSPGAQGLESEGLHVGPFKRASANFFRIAGEADMPTEIGFFTPLKNPTYTAILTKGVEVVPREVLLTPNYKEQNIFLKKQSGTGIAYIDKRSVAMFDPEVRSTIKGSFWAFDEKAGAYVYRPARGGTGEPQAILGTSTVLQPKKLSVFGRVLGYDKFLIYKGEVVGIPEYKVKVTTKNAPGSSEKYGFGLGAQKTFEQINIRDTSSIAGFARPFKSLPGRLLGYNRPAYSRPSSISRIYSGASISSSISSASKPSQYKSQSSISKISISRLKSVPGQSYGYGGSRSGAVSRGGYYGGYSPASGTSKSSPGPSSSRISIFGAGSIDTPPPTRFKTKKQREPTTLKIFSKISRPVKYEASLLGIENKVRAPKGFKSSVLSGLEVRGI